MKRFNFLRAQFEVAEDIPSGYARVMADIGGAIGAQHLAGALYEVAPGEKLWPYHWEEGQEEWLIVLEGRPHARTPDGERELRAGDLMAFVRGPRGAHQLINRADSPARVIIFSERRRPNVVFYPDSGKVGIRTAERRLRLRCGDEVDYWEGET